jgi:prepilin-type N-terminal cleavage/methylation domain-containing protein
MKHLFTKSAGFTAVEVIISIAIISVIGYMVGQWAADIFRFNAIIANGLDAQLDARRVVKTIASELREASPSSTGAYPIALASTSELIFYGDIDNDGTKERVRYYLSGLILKKDVVKPTGNPLTYSGGTTTSNIINDIRNSSTSIFTYYDTNYDGTTTTAPLAYPIDILAIRLIQVNIAVDRDPYRSPVPLYINTQVSIRNLKDNL